MERAAEVLGAGAAKALLGKHVLSDELPYVTSSIGLLGTRPSYELMRDRDTLLTIGSSFPYTQFPPDFGAARAPTMPLLDGRTSPARAPAPGRLPGLRVDPRPPGTRRAPKIWRESCNEAATG